ncbi:MAG: hypothetical protein HUN04_05330 [Desulfobacter sp.]|nr:MAG: hypothetical protein HUN04_05330 [Desulfobacter sp.]
MKPNNSLPSSLFRSARLLIAAALIAGGLAGCTLKKPVTDPAQDKEARAAVLKIREFNRSITSSKGVGRLVVTGGGQRESFKMAWAARTPNRLRLTLMVSGHPVETIAANGKQVTFVSHTGRHRPHTTPSADPDLDTYIGVPVRLSEMVAILLGQIPVREFDRAWMVPGRTGAIHANKNYSTQIQELTTDSNGQLTCFRRLDAHRAEIFGMDIEAWTQKTGFRIPASLSVYDATGRTLYISLSGMIPNAPVKESMFILTGPGS